MMDGVGVMDTGSNRPLLQMNVESIAEVKVLTSVYQAEYGRSSGLQITAVTKSGTNRIRGSAYDVIRDSKFNSNSKANILNGNAKPVLKEKDLGFSIGGPVGKPGGNNKMFFFYSQEFSPRQAGNDVVRFRFPTALERNGDFSQTTDQNGALYNFIKDPSSAFACTAADTRGCFQDGGVIGRIPQNRAVPDRAQHPEAVSAAQRQRAGRRVQLPDDTPEGERAEHAAGVPVRLSADVQAARDGEVLGLVAAPGSDCRHACPASTTPRCSGRSSATWRSPPTTT